MAESQVMFEKEADFLSSINYNNLFVREKLRIYIGIKWLCFVNENSRKHFAFELLNKEYLFIIFVTLSCV